MSEPSSEPTSEPTSGSAVRSPSGTQALDRAAELVGTVVRADEPLAFTDLQEACGLTKSTTWRMLSALERAGLVARDLDGAYVAGSLFWLYAARHDPWDETIRLAGPAMEQIADSTRETVHLSVARGDQVAQVAQIDCQYFLGTRDWSEVQVPPHCSALGKVFYAWEAIPVPEGGLEAFTDATITDPGELRRDGERSRKRGWALTEDELEEGLVGIAVPVHGISGDVVAALGVSGPTSRLEGRMEELGKQLTHHATQLTTTLRGDRTPKKEGVA